MYIVKLVNMYFLNRVSWLQFLQTLLTFFSYGRDSIFLCKKNILFSKLSKTVCLRFFWAFEQSGLENMQEKRKMASRLGGSF